MKAIYTAKAVQRYKEQHLPRMRSPHIVVQKCYGKTPDAVLQIWKYIMTIVSNMQALDALDGTDHNSVDV